MAKWETWELASHVLEYEDETHTYICDGIVIPSVTQLIERRFGDKYSRVPRRILEEAARKGTLLHKAIENAEKSGFADAYELSPEEWEIAAEFGSYLFLKQENSLTVEGSELPLLIPYKEKIIAAGRMDILAVNGDGDHGVVDVKRTSKLDDDYLSYQLELYNRGLLYTYDIKANFHGCLWLRNKAREYRLIEPCETLVDELLEEYINEIRC